jgi:hypothetical protein
VAGLVAVAVCAAGSGAAARTSALPALTISSPLPGQSVTPPWPVHYAVSGLKVTPAQPVRIRVSIAGATTTTPVLLVGKRRAGIADVPDNSLWSGRRDVVFTLLRPGGKPYTNPGASVTVTNLIIAGNR